MGTLKIESGVVDLLVTLFAVLLLEPVVGHAMTLWSELENSQKLIRDGNVYGKHSSRREFLRTAATAVGARGEFGDRSLALLAKVLLRLVILGAVFLASAFKNGESRTIETESPGEVFSFNGKINKGKSFEVRSSCVFGRETKFVLKDFLAKSDGVRCDKPKNPVIEYEEIGNLTGKVGELVCFGESVRRNCLTVRDERTMCGISVGFEKLVSVECATVKVRGVTLRDVAQRILERGTEGGKTSQEMLLTGSVRFVNGIRTIPSGKVERVTKIGPTFYGAVGAMGALSFLSILAIIVFTCRLRRVPVNARAPTTAHQIAMSWLADVRDDRCDPHDQSAADLKLIRESDTIMRISCAQVGDPVEVQHPW